MSNHRPAHFDRSLRPVPLVPAFRLDVRSCLFESGSRAKVEVNKHCRFALTPNVALFLRPYCAHSAPVNTLPAGGSPNPPHQSVAFPQVLEPVSIYIRYPIFSGTCSGILSLDLTFLSDSTINIPDILYYLHSSRASLSLRCIYLIVQSPRPLHDARGSPTVTSAASSKCCRRP